MLKLIRYRLSAALFQAAEACYKIADKVDPPDEAPSVPFDLDSFDLTSWLEEVMLPQQEAAREAYSRWAPAWEQTMMMAANMSPSFAWKDPEPVSLDGVKEVVREAYENGQPIPTLDMTSFTEAAKRIKVADPYPLGFDLPTPFLDWHDTMMEAIARARREEQDACTETWVSDVDEVVPGFRDLYDRKRGRS